MTNFSVSDGARGDVRLPETRELSSSLDEVSKECRNSLLAGLYRSSYEDAVDKSIQVILCGPYCVIWHIK